MGNPLVFGSGVEIARATVSGALGLSGQASEWITPIIANLPFAGAFGLAFLLGFKAG